MYSLGETGSNGFLTCEGVFVCFLRFVMWLGLQRAVRGHGHIDFFSFLSLG